MRAQGHKLFLLVTKEPAAAALAPVRALLAALCSRTSNFEILAVCLACHVAEAGVAPEATRRGEPGGRPTVALEAEELSGGGSGCCCCGGGGDSAGSGGGGVGEGGTGGGDAGCGVGHAHEGGQRGGTLRVFTLRCVGGFSGLAFGDAADAACFESLVMRQPADAALHWLDDAGCRRRSFALAPAPGEGGPETTAMLYDRVRDQKGVGVKR